MDKKKGFTLIELLIVIAIIGLLSAIVLVSLGSARSKAKDARIQADLNQLRTIAEMIYSDNLAYYADATHGLCGATGSASVLGTSDVTYGSQLSTLSSDVDNQNGTTGVPVCWTDNNNYCVSTVLNSGANICVGNGGKIQALACAAATTCN